MATNLDLTLSHELDFERNTVAGDFEIGSTQKIRCSQEMKKYFQLLLVIALITSLNVSFAIEPPLFNSNVSGLKVVSKASITVSKEWQNSLFFKNLSTASSSNINVESYYFDNDVVVYLTSKDGSNVVWVNGLLETRHWTAGRNRSLSNEYLSKQPDNVVTSVIPFWAFYNLSQAMKLEGNEVRVKGKKYQVKFRSELESQNSHFYYEVIDCVNEAKSPQIDFYFVESDPLLRWTFGVDFREKNVWLDDLVSSAPKQPPYRLPLARSYRFKDYSENGWPTSISADSFYENKKIISITNKISSVSKMESGLTVQALLETLQTGHKEARYSDREIKRNWKQVIIFVSIGALVAFYLFRKRFNA